ncbi:MAG: hypothetical protein R3B06_12925 [Kofleriaceae bacterium]
MTCRDAPASRPRRMVGAVVAWGLVAAAGCGRAPVDSCGDDLAGVWRGPAGDFQALDRGGRIELYPMFSDLPTDLPPGVVAAPAVIDLTRATGTDASGTVTRRYERSARFCRRTSPARLVSCRADRLTLEVTAVTPPDDWARCESAPIRAAAPTRLELARR